MIKQKIKNSMLCLTGALAFLAFTTFLTSCDETEDAVSEAAGTYCQDVPVDCSKSPFSYKACANQGSAWWELNGKKYYDVNDATDAYFAYCE